MHFYSNVARYGNDILIREISDAGKPTKRKVKYKPTLYVKDNQNADSVYRDIYGSTLKPIDFSSIIDASQFISKYRDVDGFQIHGTNRYEYDWIAANYTDEVSYDFTKLKVFSIDIENEMEIEGSGAWEITEPINLITIKNFSTGYITTFALEIYGGPPYRNYHTNVTYWAFDNEAEMLSAFIDWWKDEYPDIITGYNISFYDIPYIINRCNVVLGEEKTVELSPWGLIKPNTMRFQNKDNRVYNIIGISTLDYYVLYRKNITEPRENFTLGFICQTDLGVTKVDHSEYKSFAEFYRNDWIKFVDYNIRDTDLVHRLDQKWRLIEKSLVITYLAHALPEDVNSQMRVWETFIYNESKKKNVFHALKERKEKDEQSEGAYVKDPLPGFYHWTCAFDLDSWYPNLIIGYNISPETIVDQTSQKLETQSVLKQINYQTLVEEKLDLSIFKEISCAVTANAQTYTKEFQGLLPEIISVVLVLRKKWKAEMLRMQTLTEQEQDSILKSNFKSESDRLEVVQTAIKIFANSLFGILGNEYFIFYDERNFEAITLTGRFGIQFVAKYINEFLNKILQTKNKDYVIGSDTDSLTLTMFDLVNKFLPNETNPQKICNFIDRICKKEIQPVIDKALIRMVEYTNAYSNPFKMKRESITDKAIWTAKKRYAMRILDNEGVRYEKPKIKIKGLEIIKAVNPKFCREKMKEGLELIFDTEDNGAVIEFIKQVKKDFYSLSIYDASFPKGMNGLDDYSADISGEEDELELGSGYGLKTPIHTKGAIIYNNLLVSKQLTQKYAKIKNNSKLRFIYLQRKNPLGENVISFTDVLPPEFGLDKYIDWDLQFEKTFLGPFKLILNAIKYDAENSKDIEAMF